eukprot:12347729-Prorocentrum_lima.AAC.1
MSPSGGWKSDLFDAVRVLLHVQGHRAVASGCVPCLYHPCATLSGACLFPCPPSALPGPRLVLRR